MTGIVVENIVGREDRLHKGRVELGSRTGGEMQLRQAKESHFYPWKEAAEGMIRLAILRVFWAVVMGNGSWRWDGQA